MLAAQGLERMEHIGRPRQEELAVADLHARHPIDGKAGQVQAHLIVHELRIHLEGILRRDQEPQFLDKSLFDQVLPQLKVPVT